MVYLHHIYTRSGDEGETSLVDGTRVPKTDSRIVALGAVDELNSVIGVALTAEMPEELSQPLRQIQNDLFDMGADLAMPESQVASQPASLRLVVDHVARLEDWIDAANATLTALDTFVFPGGTPAAAHLHHARTVCRRSELTVLQLAQQEPVNPLVTIYLNRLSDLLFVFARVCNQDESPEQGWRSGQNASPE